MPENCQRERWLKPKLGVVKINSDGAFHEASKSGGWGFVLSDEWGRVLKARAGPEEFLQDAFHAELLGLLAGLKEALTWEWGEQRLRLMQLW